MEERSRDRRLVGVGWLVLGCGRQVLISAVDVQYVLRRLQGSKQANSNRLNR